MGAKLFCLGGIVAALLAACSSETPAGPEESSIPLLTRCAVSSRPNFSEPPGDSRRVDLGDDLDNGREVKTVESGAFTFGATYSDSEFEGRSLTIDVHRRARPSKLVVRNLYQVSRSETPRNNYGEGPDGHGFTGLVYVYDPSSRAELQYYCWHLDS